MKPFVLAEALAGKPVVTRIGIKVENLTQVNADVNYPLVGYVEGRGELDTFRLDGRWATKTGDNHMDLFMDSETKEGWIAYGEMPYETDEGLIGWCSNVWETEEKAKACFYKTNGKKAKLYVTQKVSWEV